MLLIRKKTLICLHLSTGQSFQYGGCIDVARTNQSSQCGIYVCLRIIFIVRLYSSSSTRLRVSSFEILHLFRLLLTYLTTRLLTDIDCTDLWEVCVAVMVVEAPDHSPNSIAMARRISHIKRTSVF